MTARYISKSPMRYGDMKFVPNHVYEIEPDTYEALKDRFEIITKKTREEKQDGISE
jgi:hypothetical protein